MDGSDIDLGFARLLCGRTAVDHHATNLHEGTPQNLSPATDFPHRLTMGGWKDRWSCVRKQQRARIPVTISMVRDAHLIDADVQQLRTNFAGPLLRTFNERYEEFRSIWNGAIRRRP